MKRCIALAGAILVVVLFSGMAFGLEKDIGQGKLNINTATIEEFQLLPGIGEVMAKNILAYRKANGPFKSINDMEKVKGIGKKKLAKLRAYLKVDGESDFEPLKGKPAGKDKAPVS
ncbi:MAG TPA: helix-hairpin-helix domain-containing protein [Deltaproteobacteria bacterium]|jgi:competence protein ComEA|nr:helix-hairpin-helix domain-containing protein [Deltaproteobacteria bacterium]HOI07653.1 helix-hairpin-helix domain-containing protein [Deltaproteobacteria bacterium]